ncbi:unnamed protein product, partial [Mesorhabditis belari]|uniref:Uncharacterized protein n=1 Tax=Mesorhabditis belari TaxID=2138241 RepID=A0AAF3FDS3_9BILA
MDVLKVIFVVLLVIVFGMSVASCSYSTYRWIREQRRIANVEEEIKAFDALIEEANKVNPQAASTIDGQQRVLQPNCTCNARLPRPDPAVMPRLTAHSSLTYMAKSLRSKFKRKMRAIARVKKEPKVLKKLEETLAKKTIEEINASTSVENDATMETDSSTKATINLKTMRKADGNFPKWMSARKVKQVKASNKKVQKNKKKKNR